MQQVRQGHQLLQGQEQPLHQQQLAMVVVVVMRPGTPGGTLARIARAAHATAGVVVATTKPMEPVQELARAWARCS